MELPSNSHQPSIELGVSTSPPQLVASDTQQYETELPMKDFSKPAVPIDAQDMKTNGPSKHNGIPIYYAVNMKAEIGGVNNMGTKLSATGVSTSATNPLIAFIDDVSQLDTLETSGKKLIIVGKVPLVRLQGKRQDVILPPSMSKYIGDQSGTIAFPVTNDNTIPLFTKIKETIEYMNVQAENDNSTYVAIVTIVLLVVAIVASYSKLNSN